MCSPRQLTVLNVLVPGTCECDCECHVLYMLNWSYRLPSLVRKIVPTNDNKHTEHFATSHFANPRAAAYRAHSSM